MDTFRRMRYAVTLVVLAMALSVFGNIVSDQVVAVAPNLTHSLALPNFKPDQVANETTGASTLSSSSTTTTTSSGIVTTAGSSSLLFNQLVTTPNSGPAGIGVSLCVGSGSVCNGRGSFFPSPSDVGSCSITANPTGLIARVLPCTISTNSYGAYLVCCEAGFIVASTAAPGPYTVTVTGSSGDSISGIFTVTRLNLTLQPTSGPVGTVVTVTGSGFASIDVACVVTSTPSGMVTNSDPCIVSNGNYTSSGVLTPFKFTVGNAEPGSYVIQVKGTAEFDSVSSIFTVTSSSNSLAPDFTLPIIGPNGLTGQTVTLSSFHGKVVLLEFMEPWCPYCQNMVPILKSLYAQYGTENVVFLSVAGPWNGATANDAANFISQYGTNWIYVYDSSGTIFSVYDVNSTSTPTFYIIGTDGSVASTFTGEQSSNTLAGAISAALGTFTVTGITASSSTSIAEVTRTLTQSVTVTLTTSQYSVSQTQSGVSPTTFVQVSSNSTISNFQFDSSKLLLNFTVSGPSGTIGYTSVVIAKNLLDGNPAVLIDNGLTPVLALSLTSNSTHYFIAFTYHHSTHQVTIGGSNTVPEFQTSTLPLLAGVLLMISLIAQKRRKGH